MIKTKLMGLTIKALGKEYAETKEIVFSQLKYLAFQIKELIFAE